MRPTVAFDIDGCLASFCEAFTTIACDMGHTDRVWHESERNEWAFDFNVDPVWRYVDRHPEFWGSLATSVSLGDRARLRELAEDINVIYVTGRSGANQDAIGYHTARWLSAWGFPAGPIFFVHHGSRKDEILVPVKDQLVGVIDDKPDVLEALKSHDIPVVARAWPYNAHVDVPRVDSIGEFVTAINEHMFAWGWG